MRLPRLRFTVGRMMIAVAVFAAAFAALAPWIKIASGPVAQCARASEYRNDVDPVARGRVLRENRCALEIHRRTAF